MLMCCVLRRAQPLPALELLQQLRRRRAPLLLPRDELRERGAAAAAVLQAPRAGLGVPPGRWLVVRQRFGRVPRQWCTYVGQQRAEQAHVVRCMPWRQLALAPAALGVGLRKQGA